MLEYQAQMNRSASRENGIKLFFFGFLTLFLELALIRYLAGNIYNLGYFPNLVLLAAFIGMGTGFVFHRYFSEERSVWSFNVSALLFMALILIVYFFRPVVPGFSGSGVDLGGEIFFSGSPDQDQKKSIILFICVFLLIVAQFALISQRTAKYFRIFPPLRSYSLDITGSCCGILAFMIISLLKIPAYLWFAALIPVMLFLQETKPRILRTAMLFCLAITVWVAWSQDNRPLDSKYKGDFSVRWSPYQKVEFLPKLRAGAIFVNGIYHQSIVPAGTIQTSFYQIPYLFRASQKNLPKYRRVLIIGAGLGNDVTAALANGADHVDAVEIDPVIAELGFKQNPAKPYQDRRTTLTVDDARAFLTYTTHRYDLIVFALTDSLVKVSPVAQLRLENYVFTKESITRAARLLSQNGNLVFYNFYRFPFVTEKIRAIVHEATGRYPITIFQSKDFSMMLSGAMYEGPASPPQEKVEIPTDDWPFLYLKQRDIPALYQWAMAGLSIFILLLTLLLRRSNHESKSEQNAAVRLAFLLMGSAFLLLESKSVIQFSLLFGTTWMNNSLVFLAVLLLVLVANLTAYKLRSPSTVFVAYALLIAFCVLGLLVPLSKLLVLREPFTRFLLASVLIFSPIFFGNLIFSFTFRNRNVAEHLFGWNLIGAALGGVLEYGSMAFGYTALAVFVAVCYTLVFLLLYYEKKLRPELANIDSVTDSKRSEDYAGGEGLENLRKE